MSVLVVDASLVIKWFLPETHSEAARSILGQDHQFFAPDLLFAELGNVIWKKTRGGELSPAQAQGVVADLTNIAVETIPCRTLAADAHSLALATGCSVYDAMYLALAVRLKTQMITADERLASALAGLPLAAPHIQTVKAIRHQ